MGPSTLKKGPRADCCSHASLRGALGKGGSDSRSLKKLREGYMPKHTKLKHPNGAIATSQERPEILADYFEKTQWGNKITKEEKRSYKETNG